jgi:(p)ppGpp synthase/HD superfamily hydrolase
VHGVSGTNAVVHESAGRPQYEPPIAIPVTRTYTGLLATLASSGYDAEALARVRHTYHLARRLLAGLHNGDGRPFVDHMVGLASLLHHYGQPPAVVIAGLLHSIYGNGDFGAFCSFARAQALIRREAGPEVEAYVSGFHRLAWNRRGIERHAQEVVSYDATDRTCLVMRLANEIDHLLDDAVLYRSDALQYLAARTERVPQYRALAETLGVSVIADDFERLLADVRTRSVPAGLCEPGTRRVLSPSYGRTLAAVIRAGLDALVLRRGPIGAMRARLWPRRG